MERPSKSYRMLAALLVLGLLLPAVQHVCAMSLDAPRSEGMHAAHEGCSHCEGEAAQRQAEDACGAEPPAAPAPGHENSPHHPCCTVEQAPPDDLEALLLTQVQEPLAAVVHLVLNAVPPAEPAFSSLPDAPSLPVSSVPRHLLFGVFLN